MASLLNTIEQVAEVVPGIGIALIRASIWAASKKTGGIHSGFYAVYFSLASNSDD
jgi:hypothetical protein